MLSKRSIPYGRYVRGKQISSLVSIIRHWKNWESRGKDSKSNITIAKGALMLSDTREAIMYMDKIGKLDDYARFRNADSDTIRDTILADFGLNEFGKKEYDLGSKTVEVSLAKDLTLVLYNMSDNKIVKSIPKRGTKHELVEKAQADFSELKRNIKKVVKSRKDILFDDFLSGYTRAAAGWVATYTKNPLLKHIAELIVWNQGNNTFVLTEDGAVNCKGQAYEIKPDVNIGVAHPIEMTKEDVKAWQKYFTFHNLKQPFEQIWEPAIDPATIKPSRYKGCMIPYYRFINQEKHGIKVEDTNFHNNIDITFDDCTAWVERIDWQRHHIDVNDNFEVVSIDTKRYTRRTNHIYSIS